LKLNNKLEAEKSKSSISQTPPWMSYLYTSGNGKYYITLANRNVSQDGTNQSTTFTKIAVDPNTLLVNTADFTYSTSQGNAGWPEGITQLPYGVAMGCSCQTGVTTSAVFDLGGTQFFFKDSWQVNGYQASGTFTLTNNNQLANVSGGGCCGWIAPTKCSQDEDQVNAGGNYIQLGFIDPSKQTNYLIKKFLSHDGNGNYYLPLTNSANNWSSNLNAITTTWTKIAVNPVNLMVNTGDFTYSTTTGSVSKWPAGVTQIPFGVAMGCDCTEGQEAGGGSIDLTGTQFQINDVWTLNGYTPNGSSVLSNNNQVVNLHAGGCCGWIAPQMCAIDENKVNQGGYYLQLQMLPQSATGGSCTSNSQCGTNVCANGICCYASDISNGSECFTNWDGVNPPLAVGQKFLIRDNTFTKFLSECNYSTTSSSSDGGPTRWVCTTYNALNTGSNPNSANTVIVTGLSNWQSTPGATWSWASGNEVFWTTNDSGASSQCPDYDWMSPKLVGGSMILFIHDWAHVITGAVPCTGYGYINRNNDSYQLFADNGQGDGVSFFINYASLFS